MSIPNKPRIVVYGVGMFGQFIIRFALQKGWSVVAAYNRAGAKVGQDIGRLAGLDKDLGVVVQDCDTADYSTLDADIGVVTVSNVLSVNLISYQRLMNAGLNVICHGTESYYPFGNNPEVAGEIDALAKKNNVTFSGSGIWDMSRIWAGILVAGPCTDLNSMFHSSLTAIEGQLHYKEQMLQVGIGLPSVDEFYKGKFEKNPIARSYKTIPEHVLFALGYTITNTKAYVEPVVFDAPVHAPILGRDLQPGEVVGIRIVGEIETAQGVTARDEVDIRYFNEGEEEHMFWEVDGLPVTRVKTWRENSAHATAACLFNRIPDVIAASPGVVLVSQMGPLKSTAIIDAGN